MRNNAKLPFVNAHQEDPANQPTDPALDMASSNIAKTCKKPKTTTHKPLSNAKVNDQHSPHSAYTYNTNPL
jgi:hypothetical protein